MKKILLVLLLAMSAIAHADEFQPFVIDAIKVEGLHRNTEGMVLGQINVRPGDRMDKQQAQQVIRALFATGYFYDVSLGREGNTLIIHVKEQPTIAKITLSGAKAVGEEKLRDTFKTMQFTEGQVFKRSVLVKVENEIRSQYQQKGKYGVNVVSTVTPLERNRVAIDIVVHEGPTTVIKQVNIVGNRVFSEQLLTSKLKSKPITRTLFSNSAARYSKEVLKGDIQILHSWYLDNGYMDFKVVSTQVTISPDMSSLYITINIDEGEQYTVGDITLDNQSTIADEELMKLIRLHTGEVVSGSLIQQSTAAISTRLGEDGFAFANISVEPHANAKTRQLSLIFHINPGKRIYVRRIEIRGNRVTRDDVIRREIRQQEGAVLSIDALRLSHERLARLGYFSSVNIETPRVPGTDDQVDVIFTVVESSTGLINAGVAYSDVEGMSVQFGLTKDNFMGTGTYNNININTSPINTTFVYSNRNPYFTPNGVSRQFDINYTKTDGTNVATVSHYSLDRQGFSYGLGLPLNEHNRASLSVGFEFVGVNDSTTNPTGDPDMLEYIANGPYFDLYLNARWTRDTRNNLFFPTSGSKNQLSLKVTTPGSDWQYFKIGMLHKSYYPIGTKKTLAYLMRVNMAQPYGGGYQGSGSFTTSNVVPFYENYYSGGFEAVRGFSANTLTPLNGDGDPVGGALDIYISLEYMFPFNSQENLRAGVFFDMGNVFSTVAAYDPNFLRASVGTGLLWITPIGVLKFSYAMPVRSQPGDVIENIQFNIGLPY